MLIKKSLETGFLIAICRPTGDKFHLSPNWRQMAIKKTLFLANFDPRSLIVKTIFDCRLSSVGMHSSKMYEVHWSVLIL